MQDDIPIFNVYYLDDSDDFSIEESLEFHNYIIDFITDRIDGIKDYDDNILCLFKISDTDINYGEAKLEFSGYLQSLDSCLRFFTESEQYEKCEQIIKLKEIIKLQ